MVKLRFAVLSLSHCFVFLLQNLTVVFVSVLNSYREPTPGWLDTSCIYGPAAIAFGTILGVIRVLFVNNNSKLSVVPVDFVNNATIAAGWETGVKNTKEVKIYNISTTNCGVTLRNISAPMRTPKIRKLASPFTIWYCFAIETHNRLLYWILSWLLHYIPAYTVDGVITALQLTKPPALKSFVNVYSKFDKMSSAFQFFLTNEWYFDEKNLNNLWNTMSDTDRTIFNFEMKSIDWFHNTTMLVIGARKYLIKDGLKGTNAAVAKQKWFKLANYMIMIAYVFIFWKILSWFWYVIRGVF